MAGLYRLDPDRQHGFAGGGRTDVKTLDQFDFSFQPAIDRKLIRELARLAFVERVDNLILLRETVPAAARAPRRRPSSAASS